MLNLKSTIYTSVSVAVHVRVPTTHVLSFCAFRILFAAIRHDTADGGPSCGKSSINTEQHKDTQMQTHSHTPYVFQPRNSSAGTLLDSSQSMEGRRMCLTSKRYL